MTAEESLQLGYDGIDAGDLAAVGHFTAAIAVEPGDAEARHLPGCGQGQVRPGVPALAWFADLGV